MTTFLGVAAGLLLLANAGSIARDRGWVHSAYATGWAGIALALLTDAARAGIALFGPPDVAAYGALIIMKILFTAAGLGGFGTYILYAWTGRPGVASIAVAVAALHAMFWTLQTLASMGDVVLVGTWGTRMVFIERGGFPGGPALGAVMFFVPLLALAIAYIAFRRHLDGRGQRIRHTMVAVALIVHLITASIQGNPEIDPDTPMLAINMLLSLGSATLARMAFRPPESWRRYGIEPY